MNFQFFNAGQDLSMLILLMFEPLWVMLGQRSWASEEAQVLYGKINSIVCFIDQFYCLSRFLIIHRCVYSSFITFLILLVRQIKGTRGCRSCHFIALAGFSNRKGDSHSISSTGPDSAIIPMDFFTILEKSNFKIFNSPFWNKL